VAWDVAIVGGGPAGCATALALRRRGVDRVLVADGGHADGARVGESVPPDIRVLLDRLGVWDAFVCEAHEPCLGSCSSWGEAALGYNDFLFNPHGAGWHLDRRRFDAFLAARAIASGAEIRSGTRFERVERTRRGFRLRPTAIGGHTSDSTDADVVVDATGAGSRVARQLGAAAHAHDRLTCVTAFASLPASSRLTRLTLLEAVEYGWWYAARVPGNRVAIAVASDADIVKARLLHRSEGWQRALAGTKYVSADVAGCSFDSAGALTVRIAPSYLLEPAAGPGWLAVGDAASAFDPISSQGIYKALADGLRAADTIASFLGGGRFAASSYHGAIAERFAEYRRTWHYFYGVEQRWRSSPFWSRRHARAPRPSMASSLERREERIEP